MGCEHAGAQTGTSPAAANNRRLPSAAPSRPRIVLGYLCLAVLIAGAATAGATARAQKLLFRWYIREIRHVEIAQDARDAVNTYPFA